MDPRTRLTTGRIAELVGGELVGPRDREIDGLASLEEAGPKHVSLLATARYLSYFERSNAGAVLLTSQFRDVPAGPACRIIVPSPYAALTEIATLLDTPPVVAWGIHASATVGRGTRWQGRLALGAGARIGENVRIGADCVIGPFAVIEDQAVLGDDCRIGPHAVVHRHAVLGSRVRLGSGTRVGAPGFGFTESETGHRRRPHIGGCQLGDDVEVGSNATVDRGSLGDTVVGPGTKIDNLVQIGHNVRIGRRCLIMAQVGIAGSTVVEDDVLLAGQAGLADHLTVGARAKVAAQAGVIGDVAAGSTVSGYPARRHRDVLRQAASLSRLAPIATSLERLVHADDRR